jgi:twitching motility protein PilT
VRDLGAKPFGMILVTGPTGSGKSTTLYSLLAERNDPGINISTVEDPIEYTLPGITQCQVNRDKGFDFATALRAFMRQDPDVLLVGEMRDLETIQLAVSAAETGHLVFGTLHTSSAAQTVDRMVDVFPPEQQTQIRVQLSGSLVAVFSQTLCKRHDPKPGQFGRVMAQEILINTSATANLIREGKTAQLYSQIQTGGEQGMQTLEKALADLVNSGDVSRREAMAKASKPGELERLIRDE